MTDERPSNGDADTTMSSTDASDATDHAAPGDDGIRGPPYARPIAPLSVATVTRHRPTFHWALDPGADGARVEVCRDRACTMNVVTFDAMGTSGAPPMDLPRGVLYWRLRGLMSGAVIGGASATWEFRVPVADTAVDSSWGSMPDVNGDGFGDVIVDDGRLGAVYVFYGGPGGIDVAPHPLRGTAPNWDSLALLGDANGDGFIDVVLGQPYQGTSATYFRGSADGPGESMAFPFDVHSMLGVSYFSGADVNGDGYADAIVGTNDNGAWIVDGAATGFSLTPTRIDQPTTSSSQAATVAAAGDVNGDGFGDALVSLQGNSVAFACFGGVGGLGPAAVIEWWSDLVASAGDVNGDGFADVLATSPGDWWFLLYQGGAAGIGGTPIRLSAMNNSYVWAAAAAGDVDADGFGDVVLGSPDIEGATIVVYFGSAAGVGTREQTIYDLDDGLRLALAGCGDVNGDGFDDVAVGAPEANRVEVYFGGAGGIVGDPVTIQGPAGSMSFGSAIAH